MMTIDGTNISTFGLMLSSPDGHLNQPARKRILNEPGFETKDIKFENKEISINLIGSYNSKADLYTKIEAFKALIKSSFDHDYILTGHGLTFSGVIIDGLKINPIKNKVRITFKIMITG